MFHVKHFATGVKVGADKGTVERALQPLLPLFTSGNVFKVGVGIQGDVSLLERFTTNLQCRCVKHVLARIIIAKCSLSMSLCVCLSSLITVSLLLCV